MIENREAVVSSFTPKWRNGFRAEVLALLFSARRGEAIARVVTFGLACAFVVSVFTPTGCTPVAPPSPMTVLCVLALLVWLVAPAFKAGREAEKIADGRETKVTIHDEGFVAEGPWGSLAVVWSAVRAVRPTGSDGSLTAWVAVSEPAVVSAFTTITAGLGILTFWLLGSWGARSLATAADRFVAERKDGVLYAVGGQGLYVRTRHFERRIPWSRVSASKRTRDRLLLETEAGVFVVPWNAFDKGEERVAFERVVSFELDARKPPPEPA